VGVYEANVCDSQDVRVNNTDFHNIAQGDIFAICGQTDTIGSIASSGSLGVTVVGWNSCWDLHKG